MANTPTPLVLNNGIYLQTRQFNADMHFDAEHVMNMNVTAGAKGMDPYNMGVIRPWIMTEYLARPDMWGMINFGKNRKYIDSHQWKWQTPIGAKDAQVMEDISFVDRPAVDGQTTKLKLSKRFGNSAILTADKYSGVAVIVTADEVIQDGDGWIHTVRLTGSNIKDKWVPKDWLVVGTTWFKLGSAIGQYSQNYDELTNLEGGMREFYMYTGSQLKANKHMTVTRDAAFGQVSSGLNYTLNDALQVMEMVQFKPGSPGYDVSLQGRHPLEVYKGDKKAMGNDVLFKNWIPRIEALALSEIEKEIDVMKFWGPGGNTIVEGRSTGYLPLGLYHQLDNSHKYIYNIGTMSPKKIETYVTNLLRDRELPYNDSRVITVETGLGGYKQMIDQLSKLPLQSGMITNSNEFINGKGGLNRDLQFSFEVNSFVTPHGIIKFKINHAFDPTQASELENPMVNGYRLSSYMYVITDITSSMDNVYEIVYEPDMDFNLRVTVGRMNYMNAPTRSAYYSSNNGPGWEWYAEKRYSSLWISDTSKTLLVKPINPKTGREFGTQFYK